MSDLQRDFKRMEGTDRLKVPIILQAVEEHKVDNFLACLGALKMKVEIVGKDDFLIVKAEEGRAR
jgi:hypothetical protein